MDLIVSDVVVQPFFISLYEYIALDSFIFDKWLLFRLLNKVFILLFLIHLTDGNTNSFKSFISGIQVAKFIVVLP